MLEDIVGFAAGFLIAVSMIPQLIKSYRTKKVRDISFWMLFIIMLGTSLWIIYGILIASVPIVAMDGFGFFVNLLLIFMKAKYERQS